MKRLRTKIQAALGLTQIQTSSASKYEGSTKPTRKGKTRVSCEYGGPLSESDGFDYSAYQRSGPEAWKEALAEAKRRTTISRVMGRARYHTLASAFSTWASVALSLPSSPATSSSETTSDGDEDEAEEDLNLSYAIIPNDSGFETTREQEATRTEREESLVAKPDRGQGTSRSTSDTDTDNNDADNDADNDTDNNHADNDADNDAGNDSGNDADDAEADSGTPANLISTGVDPDGDSQQVAHEVGVSAATNVPPNPIGEALPIPAASKWALPSPT
jgi:hypothetical protein